MMNTEIKSCILIMIQPKRQIQQTNKQKNVVSSRAQQNTAVFSALSITCIHLHNYQVPSYSPPYLLCLWMERKKKKIMINDDF